MKKEEIKEIIGNPQCYKHDFSNLKIVNGMLKGHVTILISEKDSKDFTAEELAELENMPCFYLDEFELDINKYYEESLEATLLNENEKYTFYDVEFKFSTSSGKEVA